MTVDVDAALRERIERRLSKAQEAGICVYGMHRQDSALMTCMVVNPMQPNHVHFVDGGSGGYAMAGVPSEGSHGGVRRSLSRPKRLFGNTPLVCSARSAHISLGLPARIPFPLQKPHPWTQASRPSKPCCR
jgi:hypothetical protein